jgi:hypothetical protein
MEEVVRKKSDGGLAYRLVPVLILIGVRVYRHYQMQALPRMWFLDLSLLVGWVLGWWLAEADDLFYVLMCAPHEVTGQRVKKELMNKNWQRALAILGETKGERTKLPIRNVLTGFVMTGVGLWLASSSASLVAAGMCVALGTKLFLQLVMDKDYKSWYWPFAREFSFGEHQGLVAAWGIILLWQWSILLRG